LGTLRKAALGATALASAVALTLPTVAGAEKSMAATATPIRHVVVIFQENVSFDHYFGTYPNAANTDGQTFHAKGDTPSVNGLSGSLLTANPNGVNPARYANTANTASPSTVITCDQGHNYADEQTAFDGGAMDKFVTSVGTGSGANPVTGTTCDAKEVMNYYDGNTVTALWRYAQHFAMSDNSYNTTFGPSSPGAINLVSGDTGNVDTTHEAGTVSVATPTAPNADITADGTGGYSLTSDAQPFYDDCSTRDAVAMKGINVGDQLSHAGISWGWFQGGFVPSEPYATAEAAQTAPHGTGTFIADEFKNKYNLATPSPKSATIAQGLCNTYHAVGAGLPSPATGSGQYGWKGDYIPHHEPFQYFATTANPHHLPPASLSAVGTDTQTFSGGSYGVGTPNFDTANHQYDMSDWNSLVAAITAGQLPPSALPAVSFLKAPGYEDGHAGYSDPIDEQEFVASTINALMKTPDWKSTAVFINYDDSDGWYDHAFATGSANPSVLLPINPSASPADNLFNSVAKPYTAGASQSCANTSAGQSGSSALGGEQGRCGLGPRLPMIVVSPFAKSNYVDHALSDQSSITRFIEGNWGLTDISGSFANLAYQKMATDPGFNAVGPLANLFNFGHEPESDGRLLLDPVTGNRVGNM